MNGETWVHASFDKYKKGCPGMSKDGDVCLLLAISLDVVSTKCGEKNCAPFHFIKQVVDRRVG